MRSRRCAATHCRARVRDRVVRLAGPAHGPAEPGAVPRAGGAGAGGNGFIRVQRGRPPRSPAPPRTRQRGHRAPGAEPVRGVALVMLDLDCYRHGADLLGDAWGDRVLASVVERLRGMVARPATSRHAWAATSSRRSCMVPTRHTPRRITAVFETPLARGDGVGQALLARWQRPGHRREGRRARPASVVAACFGLIAGRIPERQCICIEVAMYAHYSLRTASSPEKGSMPFRVERDSFILRPR